MSTAAPEGRGIIGRFVRGPVGFRELLQRLGPTFIKIGQFLALRADLIPQEYCNELMALLDHVPPFPWEQARAILKEDLGKDPDEVFELINPRPVAAGSLAQTHSARLRDGREVAIKIQRPDIRARVLKDLSRARLLAHVVTMANLGLAVSPRDLVEELTLWLMQELDFERELSNLTRLHRLTSESLTVKVPKPYPELSGKRVLTAEFLRGVPISEVIVALRTGRPEELHRVEQLGVDWNAFSANLMESTLEQIFRHKFFHADPHPGNLLLLPGNTIGYVDFGLCDELDDNLRRDQLRYLGAVFNGNVEEMFRALTDVLILTERTDVEAFRMEFLRITSSWLSRPKLSASGGDDWKPGQSPVSLWLTGIMRAARLHGYQVPPRILAMYRALLSAESIARQLAPDVSLRPVGQSFFSSLSLEEAMHSFRPARVQGLMLNILSLWRDSPGQVRQLLSEFAEGKFVLKVEVAESSRVSRARDRRTKLLTTAILSVGVAAFAAQIGTQSVYGIPVRSVLFGLVTLLYISAFFQWRRLR